MVGIHLKLKYLLEVAYKFLARVYLHLYYNYKTVRKFYRVVTVRDAFLKRDEDCIM